MSDEFLRIATREIDEALTAITTILGSCSGDSDVTKNSDKIEQQMHKIKGLAPMMGKESVGSLAKTLDAILKKIVSGQKVDGFFDPLSFSVTQMKKALDKPCDLGPIQKQISDIASKNNI